MESVARTLRYQALGKACTRKGIESLLVAHHADDQAETVMQRILGQYLGTGLGGMKFKAAIPECSGIHGIDQSGSLHESTVTDYRLHQAVVIEKGGVEIARPLLPVRKTQLIEYCLKHGVRWFEDATNADPTLTLRNTVRHLQKSDLLPRALQMMRLSELAITVSRKREATERIVDRLYKDLDVVLDVRAGRAHIFPPILVGPDDPQAELLHRLIMLVSPKESVPLDRVSAIADDVFDAVRSPLDHFGPHNTFQVGGVQIDMFLSKEHAARTLRLRRATPSVREKGLLSRQLWPVPTDRRMPRLKHSPGTEPRHPGEHEYDPRWTLWDGRYWIRVIQPSRSRTSTSTSPSTFRLRVYFLDGWHIAQLRREMKESGWENWDGLERALHQIKGPSRLTLPAIVREQDWIDLPEGALDQARSVVVALPSIGWSAPGWARFNPDNVETPDDWQWDIRYKHVKLSTTMKVRSSSATALGSPKEATTSSSPEES